MQKMAEPETSEAWRSFSHGVMGFAEISVQVLIPEID